MPMHKREGNYIEYNNMTMTIKWSLQSKKREGNYNNNYKKF